jgi:hypothetical protein
MGGRGIEVEDVYEYWVITTWCDISQACGHDGRCEYVIQLARHIRKPLLLCSIERSKPPCRCALFRTPKDMHRSQKKRKRIVMSGR